MASCHRLLQHKTPRFDSPAKVFAKLKSKVQREAMGAKEGSDPQNSVREELGAEWNSPRKTQKRIWMTDELKENRRFGGEAQPLTLSPIKSPQKTFDLYSDISSQALEEIPPVAERGPAYSRRERAFLESTAVSHPLFLINQTHKDAPQVRDLNGSSRSPLKLQPVENDCGSSVSHEECARLWKPLSPASVFSPMKKRLRKRKWEQQEFNKVSSSAKEVDREDTSQPQGWKASAFREDHIRGCSADQAEMIHEPMIPPPKSITETRCSVFSENFPTMSPAKMFSYMKERERKRELQEVHKVKNSMRNLFDAGDFLQSEDSPLSIPHNAGGMEDMPFTDTPESDVPVNQYFSDSSDSQSDPDPSEDAPIPAASPKPVLLEDPLVLNSPQISIPKKQEVVFKRNKWPKQAKFPSESVIYLKKWFLRRNPKGLFVDGIHREENIPWNSNIIVERVSNSVIKTVSSRVYILVGKMKLNSDSDFPQWFLKKFENGFPPNWKALYEKLVTESRDKQGRGKKRNSGKGITPKQNSVTSSIKDSVKHHRQQSSKTPESCPPTSSSACTKVSRSGRVIKPPLEYWKGGRVILDAFMNVTIHECYETSICNPEVTSTVSTRMSQEPLHVFLPCNEGKTETSVPLRKVKAPRHRRNRVKVNPEEKPSDCLKPTAEPLNSPEEGAGRITRSSKRCLAKAKESHVDTFLKKQSDHKKSSTRRSHKQPQDSHRPSTRVNARKKTVISSPESPLVNAKLSEHLSSDDELSIRRKKRRKGVHSKNSRNTCNKSQLKNVSSSNNSLESSEESGKGLRRRIKNIDEAQKKPKSGKCTKASAPTKPLPELTQSSKKHNANKGSTLQDHDEDKWTDAEVMRLQEAVSYFPKHVANYWGKVARMVGTRSAEECHNQHTSHGASHTPAAKTKKSKKEKVEASKVPATDHPVISARVGTLKRKQQVRQFLETMPREDVDDVFSSAYMQNKRFELPSLSSNDDKDLAMSDLEPLTPASTRFPEVKTPQCLHITPGMMGSPNRNNDDKYVYQLQKRIKKNQFNACKHPPSSKSFTPTPSVKRAMRRCGNTENDTFVVWEMFPGNDGALSESGEEEEDFYFSDD